jgi:predicted aspartyl protease
MFLNQYFTSTLQFLLRTLCLLGALTLVQGGVVGQRSDLKRLKKGKNIVLPFTMVNDFIVIQVLLDNVIPVQFIVDTGAENTVLLEKRMSDMLNVDYRRTYNIRGADVETTLTAYLATGIDLRLADVLLARDRSMLVLAENYFNFERVVGQNIQGILGADFLMRFIVEIDYKKNVIVLHEPRDFKISKAHKKLRSAFVRHRPYVQLPISISSAKTTRRRLLLDSGAGLTLLIHTFGDSTDIDLPVLTVPTYIASGLGGSLEGSVGRARKIELGGKELSGVVTYFQPIDTTGGIAFMNEREGIIGNRLLKRFNVVIDYLDKAVYLKPEGRWKQRFRFDRSGMALLAGGRELRTFNVASIIPDSPAGRAGLKIGDRIAAVNGKSSSFLTLSGIIHRLEGKAGRKIKIKYSRNGVYTTVEFRLEELI